jgi:filamentous hemagglutinin
MFSLSSLFQFARNFLAQLALISLILEQFLFVSSATAQTLPITPDGTTNTQIDRAANDVPIVNIAAPNSGGLSHNKYTDYNVNQQGLILNNATGSQNGVFQTQIGGLINDNANLKNSGAASVILNEVTSNNISQINGYTEIAGKKADLILANPNGIQMNGAGFINVSRLTAIVGSSNQFNPNPNDLTFSLSNHSQINSGFLPKLTIQGAGLDLEAVSATDLVASMMEIVAPIYGGNNEVNLRTGDQTFNYANKAVSSDNSSPGSNLPDQLAIDASALGKIQAGRIYIIASKEGFGIKWDADMLASRSGINIDNQGNITYNNIASEVGNIEVTSRKGSITQTGISQTKDSGSDLKLNAFGNIINSGQFLSARNINLETSTTFRNEGSITNFSSNDFIIKAADLVNLGTLAANRDLKIEATSTITNSKELVAGRVLELTAVAITNDDSIYGNSKISITATNSLTNNKDIISIGTGTDDGINIIAKTLNNNKQIAAKKNLTISSDQLNNNTLNSTILALNDVTLNITSLDNSNSIQALNNLAIRNLKLNNPDASSLLSITSQSSSITNSNGSLFAGSLLDIDLGNSSYYTITGTVESAGNIKIKANNITNQTAVKANGYVKVEAANQFINGSLGGDNSNIQFATGTYLDITAQNLLSNYGTLSSNTDLTLTSSSGNINNNADAEIIGGSGKLTLSAKNGTVYQNSLHSIVANGDYSLDVTDFVNTGRVDVAGNLTLNVANDLTNEAAAMIYAGGTMELNVVNNLTNKSGAVIYSEGNMTIQKYATTSPSYNASNNKSNLVSNLSGQIISYGGNMRIDANTITNDRTVSPFNALIDPYNNGTLRISWSEALPQYWGNYSWVGAGSSCFGHNCQERFYYYYAQQLTNSGSVASSIQSGGTLTFNAGTLSNNASNISSTGNLTINADTLNNHSINDPGLYARLGRFSGNDDFTEITPISGASVYSQSNPSSIKSGGTITLNVTNNISNATTTNGTETIATKTSQIVNSIDVDDLTKTGALSIDLTKYFSGTADNGLFTKSTNPNGPLFETRSQFIDQSKFFGSDYFYQKIGLNLTDVQTEFEQTSKRLVGDQFFQTKIIEEQLQTITKNSLLLSSSETNSNNEIKSLLDNAADEYSRLGLTTNNTLTQTQINNLQKDIIWFETQTIDGATYIVPKIYLTQATRDNLKNGNLASKSTIYAASDVNITSTSGGITNTGSIISKNNITLSASSNIINKSFSDINASGNLSLTSATGGILNKDLSSLTAGNNLSLTANQDIKNIGSSIEGLGNVNLTSTAGNILSTAAVSTNDANLLNSNSDSYVQNGMGVSYGSGNIKSEISQNASIKGGAISINAANDFTNLAADVTATKNTLSDSSITSGNISVTAGDDVNIGTLALRNRTETRWSGKKGRGGVSITDTTTNVSSEINSAGSIAITTNSSGSDSESSGSFKGSNIAITGSDVTAKDNITINAKDDVTIASAEDSYYSFSAGKAGRGKSYLNKSESTTQVSSDITTTNNGNISINSGVNNTDIVGIDGAKGNLTITASNLTTKDEDNNSSNNTGSGNITLAARNEVNIESALNTSFSESHSSKKGSTVKKTSTEINSANTNVQSDIVSNNNVIIISGSDTNITASNISGEGSGSLIAGSYTDTNTLSSTYGQTIVNNDAEVNIFNGKDTTYHYSHSTKTKTGLNVQNLVIAAVAIAATAMTGGVAAPLLVGAGVGATPYVIEKDKSTTTKGSSTETIVKSNLSFGNDLTIASASDLTVKASNLTTEQGDITLTSGGDVKILSDTENNSSYQNGSTNGLFGSNKKQSVESNSTNNVSSVITAGSDKTSVNGNLELTSVNDTTLQAAKLNANKDITITTGENLNLLVAANSSSKSHTSNDETTFNFTNGSSGFFKTEVINNEILAGANSSSGGSAGSLTINVGGGILAQYSSKSGEAATTPTEGINDSTLARDFSATPELAYINALNPTQTQYQSLDEIAQSWDQTTRGLNENGQLVIAAAAAAIAIGTGGIGSGLSGAIMTAVATTAATTATISATNSSMNADGNLAGSLDDVGKTALKDTTSEEAIKNYAISAAVAGAAAWAVQASSGTTSLEKGKDFAVYKPSEELIKNNPDLYSNYNGVIDPSVNNIGMANVVDDVSQVGQPITPYPTDPFTKNFWQGFFNEGGFISNNANQVGGMNSMSTMHDPVTNNLIMSKTPIVQITIPPAIAVQYCATFPAACGVVVSNSMNNDFGTKK